MRSSHMRDCIHVLTFIPSLQLIRLELERIKITKIGVESYTSTKAINLKD